MAERIIMPGTHRQPKVKQSRAEAQEEYDAVTARDKDCQAPLIDPTCDPCTGRLTREHVRYAAAMGGRRQTARTGMLILCIHHHLDGWATSHKNEEREHLRKMNP